MSELAFGARVIEIAFDSEPLPIKLVAKRLSFLSQFVKMVRPREAGYRWAISIALHLITQDADGATVVGRVCRAPANPPMTRIAWNDSLENPR